MPQVQQPQPLIKKQIKASAVEQRCEFTTTEEHLARALRVVSGVAGKNPALPVLGHVLLKREQNQLRLSTTDLEVGVTAWLPGKLRGEGALTVPLRPLAEYVQNLPTGAVTLLLEHGTLTLNAERAHAVFQGEAAENFPLIPHLNTGDDIVLPTHHTRQALNMVLYAIASDDTRPELAGVLLRGEGSTLTFAATDSYRLAEARYSLAAALPTPFSLILPRRAAQEVYRALEGAESATLRMSEGQVLLLTPTLHVVSRRVEGVYPDYTQIIPKNQPTSFEIERASLLQAIRASAVFSGNTANRVVFDVGSDTLRVAATTPEMGETETHIPADVEGGPTTIAFNERFLKDALSALPTNRVRIYLGSSATPAVFRPAPPPTEGTPDAVSVLALIMPIKG